MSIHNYLRPLWSNGPHVVHDAPPNVRTAFELLFKGKPRRQTESIVQMHRVRPLDVTVAWLEIEVEMPVEGTGLSYRRARYLHAFAADGPGPDELTTRRARALFEEVYGEDLKAGVHAAQRSLIGLEHPARSARASALFVSEGKRPDAAPEAPTGERTRPAEHGAIGRVAVETHANRPAPSLTGDRAAKPTDPLARAKSVAPEVAPILSDVDLLPPVPKILPAADRGTPVEIFDRAFASRAVQAAPRRAAVEPIERDPAGVDRADGARTPETNAEAGESASLSMLLRSRLVRRSVDDDAQAPRKSTRADVTP